MSLVIVTGEPGGPQRAHLASAATDETLWIGIDQEPPPDISPYATWRDTPWAALAAVAARLSHGSEAKDLTIPTLNGFAGPTQRAVIAQDLTLPTLTLCKAVIRGDPLPGQIIIAGLSTMYERALAIIGGTVGEAHQAKASELVAAFAGSALTHWLWDLQRSTIPILADAWEVPQGKKLIPYIPRGVSNIADQVVRHDVFDLAQWRKENP